MKPSLHNAHNPQTGNKKGVEQYHTERTPTPGLLNPLPLLLTPSRPAADVYVWGCSDNGQLGRGILTDEVPKPRKHAWIAQQVAEGIFGSAPGAGIIAVAAGGMHTYLLDENGVVWSAGVSENGALGRKYKTDNTVVSDIADVAVVHESEFGIIQGLKDTGFHAVCIVAGDSIGVALNAEGKVRAWGSFKDDSTVFFSPDTKIQWYPTPFGNKSSTTSQTSLNFPSPRTKISTISAGENHILALSVLGDVYAWGVGSKGELGQGQLRASSRLLDKSRGVPLKVIIGAPREMRKAVCVGTGIGTSFAVDTDGNVWAWGANGRGQLGLGVDLLGEVVWAPTKIKSLSREALRRSSTIAQDERVVQISGGDFHTVFLTSAGRVLVCGGNDSRELGLLPDHPALSSPGFADNSLCVPEELLFPDVGDSYVVSISCTARYSLTTTREGALLSWGTGGCELGLGEDVETAPTPTVVVRSTGPRFALSVSAGGQHAVGLFTAR